MWKVLHFLWAATRGHRLSPWRSKYVRWRIETYAGVRMHEIGFIEFCTFMFRERAELLRFLKWTAQMEDYARAKPRNRMY